VIDLKHLRVLIEIVERGTFSAAAEALSYTQGAVSQQVAALERTIGAPVLVRGSRPLQLTDQGRVLVEHGRAILAQFETARAELDAVAAMTAGRVHMGSFPAATVALGAPAVTRFREQHPDIDARVIDLDPEETVAALQGGEIDLGLIFDYDVAPARLPLGLHVELLHEDPMLLALPARYPHAYDEGLRLADLASENWICGRPQRCAAALAAVCSRAGFTPRVTSEISDHESTKALVAAGAGVALVPHLATRTLPDGVVLRPLAGLPVRRILAVTLGLQASRPAAALLGFLLARRRSATAERIAV
jgi:DNA-binding transcriptional LysR family regulator